MPGPDSDNPAPAPSASGSGGGGVPAPSRTRPKGGAVAGQGKTVLPSEPRRSWRARKQKEASPAPAEPPAQGPSAGASHPVDAAVPDEAPRKIHRMALAMDERQRLLLASGLGGGTGLARVAGSDTLAFRCPACLQQVVCTTEDAGCDMECPFCQAMLRLPPVDGAGRVELLATAPVAGSRTDVMKAHLPELRDEEEGRSGSALFQEMQPIRPEEVEGTDDWGLDRAARVENVRRSRAWRWLLPMLVVIGLASWVLVRRHDAARATVAQQSQGEAASGAVGGPEDWDQMSPRRFFLAADAKIRAYLEAPTLEVKVAHVRHAGDEMLRKMRIYYGRRGGYAPETDRNGPVQTITLGEERTVGGRKFQMVIAGFRDGGRGIYALGLEQGQLVVDWEYSVGYGEVTIPDLWAERPIVPVLMRVYLTEGRYFGDGFEEPLYRQFDLTTASLVEKAIPVYARRGSPVEVALREAWFDASVDAIGKEGRAARRLDFVVRVRFENAEGHAGFLIDEVLARGWILP